MTRQVPLGGAESLTAVGGAESLATFGGVESVATMGGADSLTKVGGADAAVAVVGAAEGSVGAAESPASDPQPRESSSRSRSRKVKPGRITFVGSGPGDPGLLTTRAQAVLAHAELVFTDPDVPEAVLALVGTDLPPAAGPAPAKKNDKADKATDKSDKSDKADKADDAKSDDPAVIPGGPEVRPALGDPAEVAKR